MKGLQLLLKSFGLDMEPETLAMIQSLIPQLPAKINEASAAINAALQNFDARLRALEAANGQLNANFDTRLRAIETRLNAYEGLIIGIDHGQSLVKAMLMELSQGVQNGNTGRASDAPGPTDDAGASGGGVDAGTGRTGRQRRSG